MANVRGTRGTGSRGPNVQQFVPSSAWTEDSNGHYLLVDLPDFKKEEVKLQLDSSGHLTVSGERLVKDNKYVCFEQSFQVPQNSDLDKITGTFDGEILYVTVPKHVAEIKEEPENKDENVNSILEENVVHENVEKDDDKHGNDHAFNHEENKGNKEKKSHIESFHTEFLKKWGKEATQLERVMKMLKKNKGIILIAMIAFSLGVLVARKFNDASI
ncbi:HSP20 domain-containing protein [Cephalotus follicularis]|uniref:HSP20 domain-containing protein n=1 Tax=Cephalotus follicularis TaxID=3775 RepID=A0A1Q3C1C8_CEPFO|nr:HSP20 domain-containing protein [Cephalotus follicularis]